jgi:cyclo(L-tyrosyl-L-tyrosyl) synthase
MDVENNLEGQVYEQGYGVLKNMGTAIVGISLGNSYFKKETLEELLTDCTKQFSRIIIMIPDTPAIHNYKALGYSDIEAERKARLKGNAMTNRTKEILSSIQETYTGEISIANWNSAVTKSSEYTDEYMHLNQLYQQNKKFRADVRTTTKNVIETKLKPGSDIEKSIDEGVKYLLSELTFVSTCPKVYNTSVAYVYHNPWKVYENYVNGVYDEKKNNLGLVIMK